MADDPRPATAAIDPPLFAGLYMSSRSLIGRFGTLHETSLSGHADVDRVFVLKAFDVARVTEMVHAGGGEIARALVLADSECGGIVVKDRVVEVHPVVATDDADDVTRALAARVAKAIGRFTSGMAARPAEIDGRARWNDLAVQLGLSFDPRRWHIFGKHEGIEVSVKIDGSPPAVSTICRARWRMPLACGMVLRRGFRESVGFTSWSDGKPPGFPELDKVTVMQARDPERARALLGDAAVRSAVAALAAAGNVWLDDVEIGIGRGGFAGRTEIRQRLDELCRIVDRITPALSSGAGPFR